MLRTTRFSDLDWATELKEILVIGAGGIGSYTVYNLSRIGHSLNIFDYDSVDETNTIGGQLYRTKDVGKNKVSALTEIVREFGCINEITTFNEKYTKECGSMDIVIVGPDNMEARKQAFEAWEKHLDNKAAEFQTLEECLFIDGRLLAELSEVFVIQGDKPEQIEEYKTKWLFEDSEIEELSCTAKQTSFMAMHISSIITTLLCNWLTNNKLGMDLREIPFHTRFYSPILDFKTQIV